jgi:enoyl-CoA hydratase/carnithine racemase
MAVRPFKADKALQVGLVTDVVDPDELMKSSIELAQSLIALAPQAAYSRQATPRPPGARPCSHQPQAR